MDEELIVGRVLDDEGLVGDLDEPEAQRLVDWAVQQAKAIAAASATEQVAMARVEKVCARARAMARLVALVAQHDLKNAQQVARAQTLPWPIPAAATPAATLQWLLENAPAPV